MPFESRLVLGTDLGEDDYIVDLPLAYRTHEGALIIVPVGFVTNLASVPRLFWRIFPRDGGKWRAAAVIHDYMVGVVPWSEATLIFDQALQDNGANWFQRKAMITGVWFGGLFRWGDAA